MERLTSSTSLALAAVLVLSLSLLVKRRSRHTRVQLPRGPPSDHWLYGTIVPSYFPHHKFKEWMDQYGPDLISFRNGYRRFVIVGSVDAANAVMEKEGGALVDRPRTVAAGETLSGGMRTLLVGEGARLKKLRRALHSALQEKVAVNYEPIQYSAAVEALLNIFEEPGRHQEHVKKYAASVIMSITYGKSTRTSYSDPAVQEVNKTASRLGKTLVPGAYKVDIFPILAWVPGYLSTLRSWHREELALFSGQLEAVREKMNSGKARPCFAQYLIDNQDALELSNAETAYLGGSMFGAGADTTASAISIVLMAAAIYSEEQRTVQKELDAIVGSARLPTFSDIGQLPCVKAFVMESYRWRPVSVGGFAHRATRDILYKDMIIPAGTTVIGNHWGIFRDPAVFDDPEDFKTSRWLDEQDRFRPGLRLYNFGFGRRVCVGQHVANRSVMINCAVLLWAFSISEDPSNPIDTLAFTNSANTHPLPFKLRFKPRIPNLERLLAEAHGSSWFEA